MLKTETVIQNIQKHVRASGINQGDIMENARLTKRIGNWRGQNQSPRLATLTEVANALGCSVSNLIRDVIPEHPVPEENEREPIELLANTGSGLEVVTILWQTYEGRLTEGFIKKMDALDLWDRTQVYHCEAAEYRYGWVGGFYLQTLGEWALMAPGRICGPLDPDPVFAEWCKVMWREVMDDWQPRRWDCYVRSDYGGPAAFRYEGAYYPCVWGDKPALLVVARAT